MGGVWVFSGMDTSLRLCVSDAPALVCSARGVGRLGGASASKGGGKGLAGEHREGGGVRVARMLPKLVALKGRSLLVARLQASQVVGLIHCPWLWCLCASVCRFVSCLTPADAGSV